MEFPCPSCGSELTWKPGAGALVCPHCGTTAEAPGGSEDSVVEYPLSRAALDAPRGYGTETRSLSCGACGAGHDSDPKLEATRCPFCGSAQVVAAEEGLAVIRPETVLPFSVEREQAVRALRDWLSSLWFRPSSLKSGAQIQSLAGVYLPVWTFDARASSSWTAEAGHHYQVDEEVQVQEGGKTVTRTRKVTKTRWEPASGSRTGAYDDWLVQASTGLDQSAIKGLQPFDLTGLKPYDKAFLAGFQAERYGVELEQAWAVGQREIGSAERSQCASEVPGDTQRNLEVRTAFDEVTFKHTLLPVWIAAYQYQGKVYRYLVNGQSAKATGDAPYSMWKIVGFVLAILFAIATCMGLLSLLGLIGGVAAS